VQESRISGLRLAAPRVAGVVINDGAAQRSRVTRLRVEFDAPVVFDGPPADAFTLTRVADGLPIGLTAGPATPTSVELLFAGPGLDAGSLPDGRFTLTLFAASLLGDGLDGNGDGVGGDDFVLVGSPANGLFRLFGDASGNGQVDASDFLAFRLAFLTADPVFDADADGRVTAADFLRFRARYLAEV
jgi:hypothetical protein